MYEIYIHIEKQYTCLTARKLSPNASEVDFVSVLAPIKSDCPYP